MFHILQFTSIIDCVDFWRNRIRGTNKHIVFALFNYDTTFPSKHRPSKLAHHKSCSRYTAVSASMLVMALCAWFTREPECRDWHKRQHSISETPVSATASRPSLSYKCNVTVWKERGGGSRMLRIKSALLYYNRIMASSNRLSRPDSKKCVAMPWSIHAARICCPMRRSGTQM